MTKTARIATTALAACAIALAGTAYFALDPATNAIFPRCPFLTLTGLKCPGCGSQRAIHCLLHADIRGAAAYNFLLVASLPAVALLLVGELVRKRRPGFYAAVNNTKFTAGVLLVVAALLFALIESQQPYQTWYTALGPYASHLFCT